MSSAIGTAHIPSWVSINISLQPWDFIGMHGLQILKLWIIASETRAPDAVRLLQCKVQTNTIQVLHHLLILKRKRHAAHFVKRIRKHICSSCNSKGTRSVAIRVWKENLYGDLWPSSLLTVITSRNSNVLDVVYGRINNYLGVNDLWTPRWLHRGVHKGNDHF